MAGNLLTKCYQTAYIHVKWPVKNVNNATKACIYHAIILVEQLYPINVATVPHNHDEANSVQSRKSVPPK